MKPARPLDWTAALRRVAPGPLAIAMVLNLHAAPDALAAVSQPGSADTGLPEQSQGLVDQVVAHLRKQDYERAIPAAQKLVQSNPDNPSSHNLLGLAYQGKRDIANARAAFEKAIGLKTDFVPALMNLAQLEQGAGAIDAARSRYTAVLGSEPKNILAMIGLARLEFAHKQPDAGFKWLERAKAANPQALAPRLLLATQLLQTGNSLKALAEMTEAHRSRPNDPEVLELLGQTQLATGRFADAATTYKRLIALRPQSPTGPYRLATAQIGLGELPAARDNLKKALQNQPGHVDALRTLSGLELQAGRFEEALKSARQIQTLQPKSPVGFLLEGDILSVRKLPAQALPVYEKAVALGAAGSGVIKVHAAQLASGVPKAQADAQLQTWLQANPKDFRVLRYQASEFMRAGMAPQAIERFEKVVENEPRDGIALNNLAGLYHRQKDPRAIDLAERAYSAMPESAAAADTLGWISIT